MPIHRNVTSLSAALLIATGVMGICTLGGSSQPRAGDDIASLFTEGKIIADARYRYEFVDQDGIAKKANAHTARLRLGYLTGTFMGFQGLLEGEGVARLGSRRFNDTVKGTAGFPVVADPNNLEANRYWISNQSIPDTKIKVGRQRILLDNVRYVGNVGWRQNEQTFDAVRIDNSSIDDVEATYAYLWLINRIFGEDSRVGDFETESHIINVSYSGLSLGKLTGYGYILDIGEAPALSSKTFGLRLAGKKPLDDDWSLLYTAEAAWQTDHATNPNSDNFTYLFVEPGIAYGSAVAKLGYERLDGDGNSAFQTPLATLHAFQGWADKFLSTPANGMNDVYLKLGYTATGLGPLDGTKITGVFHDFSAVEGSAHYGNELDVVVSRKFFDYFTVGAKYAFFNADDVLTDTHKFWFWIGAKY
ncbi:MAG: alginate export family protein [Alphaproteobacteria bacterium]